MFGVTDGVTVRGVTEFGVTMWRNRIWRNRGVTDVITCSVTMWRNRVWRNRTHRHTPHVVTPRLRHMVTPVTPNSVTPHVYATYGTPSLASLRHPASLLALLHDVTT